MMKYQDSDIDYLLSPKAIRERTRQIYDLAVKGGTHFKICPEKLSDVSQYVLKVIREKYPTLDIPFHSRHGHLNANGVNRLGLLSAQLKGASKLEIAKAQIDLVFVSVLLDAGAGDSWKYFEEATQQKVARSEGLAVASFHMFTAGAFSQNKQYPWQADAKGLSQFSAETLRKGFQVSEQNPLLGVEGRVHLLNKVADVLNSRPEIFKNGRISDMLDFLILNHPKSLKASAVLDFVLRIFGEIWPSRIQLGKQSLGDVWSHSALGLANEVKSLVPFHKLSQWLTYSLLVPIIDLGVTVTGVDELTGLAEYRNGGLLIDSGLIELRDPKLLTLKHAPDSEIVIEWRALTVVFLDMIADQIRSSLKMTKEELPLAKVLEGGTWHAGRKIAREKRPGGEPPLNIISDGTVF